jgi:hypothetical protein
LHLLQRERRSIAEGERLVVRLPAPGFAIDQQTIKVEDDGAQGS